MIDAYTIGVTLALEDGVSAGLATIRAELVDVLAVTEKATAALAALRAMAGEVTGVAPPVPRARPSEPVLPVSQEIAAPPAPSTPAGPADPLEGGARPRELPVAPSPEFPLAPARTELAATPAPVEAASVAPVMVMRETAEAPAPQRAEVQAAPAPATPTGVATTQRSVAVAPVMLPAPSATDENSAQPPQSEVRIDAALFVRPTPPRRTEALTPARHHAPHRAGTAARRRQPAAPRDEPEILRGTGMRTPEQSAERAPRAERDDARDTPREGTIHLDGAVLGAWIEDYLTHRLSRPRHAGTGFDMRMTPAWPGMAME